MKKIVVTLNSYDLLPDQLERLKKLGKVQFFDSKPRSTDEWLERCQGADVICSGRYGLIDRVYELHNVFISLPFVAVDWVDKKKANEKNIIIANSPGCNSAAVSEWAIGMMINLLRRFPQYINATNPPIDSTPDNDLGLEGKHVTVLGSGHVGFRVVNVCRAFKMQVTVFHRGDDLHQSAKNADVIIDCLGANESTHGLLDKKFFQSCNKGTRFITVTSPVIWDVESMLEALDTGQLAGVATDTASIQVGDTSDPLFKRLSQHPKILATPHIAYRSDVTTRVANDMMIANIEAWVVGKPINIVT